MKRLDPLLCLIAVLFLSGAVSKALFSLNLLRGTFIGTSVYVGALFAQVILLGIWGAVGTGPADNRVRGVVAGLAWLGLVNALQFGGERDLAIVLLLFFAIALPIFAIITWISWFRLGQSRLRIYQAGSFPTCDDRLQFGIRDILLVTAIASAQFALVKVVAIVDLAIANLPWWGQPGFSSPGAGDIMIQLVVGIGSPPVAVAALWACLGFGRVVPRLMLVAAIAAAVLGFPFVTPNFNSSDLGLYAASLAIGTTIVVASLLIVRQRGYRFVPLAFPPTAANTPMAAGGSPRLGPSLDLKSPDSEPPAETDAQRWSAGG